MTSRLYNQIQTDPKREREGVELIVNDVARIKVSRSGGQNQNYNAAVAKMQREHGRALATGVMQDDKALKLTYTLFAEHIVQSWEYNTAPEGQEPVWADGIDFPEGVGECNVENVVRAFTELPDLFAAVKQTSEATGLYRKALVDNVAGN